jgi:hypothetical protein
VANPHEGEVVLEAGDRRYTLRINNRTVAILERELGKLEGTAFVGPSKVLDVLWNGDRISVTATSLWLWAALRHHHKEVTLDQAVDLIGAAGGLEKVLTVILEGVRLAWPPPGGNEENPRMPGR